MMCVKTILFFVSIVMVEGKIFFNATMPRTVSSRIISSTLESKPILQVIASIGYGGPFYQMGPICTESMKLALQLGTPTLLPKYDVEIALLDDRVSRNVGIAEFIKATVQTTSGELANRIPLALGPQCLADIYTGQVMKAINYVGMTAATMGLEIYNNRKIYSNHFPLSPPFTNHYVGLAEFVAANGWKRVAIISEMQIYLDWLEKTFMGELDKRGIEMLGVAKIKISVGAPVDTVSAEQAVRELITFNDPRVILVQATAMSRVACWLHRFGLYGPSYVLLMPAQYSFQSNDILRFTPWCTEQMLADVLKSVIYFGLSPMANINPTEADSFGVTGEVYDNFLKDTIAGNLELTSAWWIFRTFCYDETMGALHLLNATEERLNKRNETLLDWQVEGSKYNSNPSEIVKIMRESLIDDGEFRTQAWGVKIDRNTTLNSDEFSGFFQMLPRLNRSDPTPLPLKAYPVALFIHGRGNASLVFGPTKLKWQTSDEKPPLDAIRTVLIAENTLNPGAYYTLLVLAIITSAVNAAILVRNVVTKKQGTATVVKVMKSLLLAGNFVILSYIFTLPREVTPHLYQNCMAGYFLLVIGYVILLGSIFGVLEFAALVNRANGTFSSTFLPSRNQKSPADHRKSDKSYPSDKSAPQRSQRSRARNLLHLPNPLGRRRRTMNIKATSFAITACIVGWTLFNCMLMMIWFIRDPLTTDIRYKGDGHISPNRDTILMSISYACSFERTSTISLFVQTILAVNIGLVMFRILYLGFRLSKAKCEMVPDLPRFCMAGYAIIVLVLAAGLVLGAFLAQNEFRLQIGISTIALAIPLLNIAVIFLISIKPDPKGPLGPNASPMPIAGSPIPMTPIAVRRR